MRILYVTSISNTLNAFLIPHIDLLVKQGHQVDIACGFEKSFSPELLALVENVYELDFKRQILKNNFPKLAKEFRKIINENDYDIIHTHTPIASALVRWVGKKNYHGKMIYTAHGFHFYEGSPKINWLVYYPIELILSNFTDAIITINKEDYLRSKRFAPHKTYYLPGVGFSNVHIIEKQDDGDLKEKLNIPESHILLLSVGELNKNKNHENVIKAMSFLKDEAISYLICGEGELYQELEQLITESDLVGRVLLLGHRTDIPYIMSLSDIYIHPSYREGLSMAVMEAMGAGLPIICTNIRGNRDLILPNQGGLFIEEENPKQIAEQIQKLLKSPELRNHYGELNQDQVKNYSLNNVLTGLTAIYNEVLEK